MFRWFLVLTLLLFIFLIGRYYTRVFRRFLSFWRDDVAQKWKILLFFFSYFLAFCTINVFSSLGIFLLHFFVFSLLTEFLFFFSKKLITQKAVSFLYKSSLIPLLFTMAFFLYGYYNIRHVVETKYEVVTDKVFSPFRILFVSDSHYGTVLTKKELEKIQIDMEALSPDIVLLGGDIVDENTTNAEMKEIFEILGSISSTYGTYFVYGNHDRQKYTKEKSFSVEELMATLEINKITPIVDEIYSIRDDILLVGREDFGEKRKSGELLLKNIDSSKYVILVDHQPVMYEENKNLGVDLMLSGHTHAGQIFPAGYFIKWFHMADLWYGQKRIDSMDVLVSSGLAGWGYPIRTQEHSEYVILDILKN